MICTTNQKTITNIHIIEVQFGYEGMEWIVFRKAWAEKCHIAPKAYRELVLNDSIYR
jgi:hypothetical protein